MRESVGMTGRGRVRGTAIGVVIGHGSSEVQGGGSQSKGKMDIGVAKRPKEIVTTSQGIGSKTSGSGVNEAGAQGAQGCRKREKID